jgi:HAD superfamily hydrolase (TIGR01509 family)
MKALLFDMDGVLVDSEPMHTAVALKILASYGVHLTLKDLDRFAGTTMHYIFSTMKQEYQLTVAPETLIQQQLDHILDIVMKEPQKLIDGIPEILSYLKGNDFPTAIASSSPKRLVNAVVDRLGIKNYFEFLLSGEDVTHSKPAPEIYLLAAKRLGIAPKDCVVIEDSKNGTIAAKDAGMFCIGFKNLHSGDQDLSRADIIVPTLVGLDMNNF